MNSGPIRYGNLGVETRLPLVGVSESVAADPRLHEAVRRATDWLLSCQHPDGHWCGELEGDTILESEYVLLLTWLERTRGASHNTAFPPAPASDSTSSGERYNQITAECAEYIRRQQLPDGGWSLFPGGPLEISSSVKAYWVLKIAGDKPHAEHMQRARTAILAAGGAERVNSFTRYYLALLGVLSYQQCPAVPPELMLLPKWCPLNIYEMSSWSRTIVVPLSLLWAFQPRCSLPSEHGIDELFLRSPAALSLTMPRSSQLDDMRQKSWIPWDGVFRSVDRVWKFFEMLGLRPFRSRAIRLAKKWILARLEKSDGLGAIFPPIIWSVIALRCLGFSEDSPEVRGALHELEKLTIREAGAARLEPCRSPVWDTALAVNALREAGISASEPHLERAVNWLLSKEVRSKGDWSVHRPQVEPGGWYFEYNNEFYPDVDDTIMATMALGRCLPGDDHADWSAALLNSQHPPSGDFDLAVTLAGRTTSPERIVSDIERMQPMIAAIRRGIRWTLSMQSRNGGWGAFDVDNDRELLTRVPFADHNAMIDPPTADITARVLEMFGRLGLRGGPLHLERALEFVWDQQESDNCWYGRWGVNYIYGTWQVLVGLTAYGVPQEDVRLKAAARWLRQTQQSSGGWGETARSYDEPHLRGQGPVTPSQTAWALMGLMAAGEADSLAVRRGVDFLLETQREDGTWDETEFTGTGFPRVFYLRYHLYRHYFPLMALGRYAASRR